MSILAKPEISPKDDQCDRLSWLIEEAELFQQMAIQHVATLRAAYDSVGGASRETWRAQQPYADYLKSPEWQRIRQSALDRANHRCQVCGSTQDLHVHHNIYDHRGNERPWELVVLCANCHALYHAKGPSDE